MAALSSVPPVPVLGRVRAALRSGLTRLRSRRNSVLVGLTVSLVVLLTIVVAGFVVLAPDTAGTDLTLSQLRTELDQGEVTTATFLDEDAVVAGHLADGTAFTTAYPRSDALTALLVDDLAGSGADVAVDPQVGKARVRLLLTVLLPLMILANLFALFMAASRGGSDGIGEVIDFGRAGAASGHGAMRVGFGDVAGLDAAEVELREVVEYLRDPARYEALGATPPKGVLLFGAPGTGKTLLARAVAGEAGVPFFSVAGAQFVESLVGVGAARIRDLFATVRAAAPAILFVDELDALGRRRGGAGGSGASDEREQTLNQLLVELDGFGTGAGVVLIGATNRPDILDPALLRPGRFDRHVHVQPPDLAAREEILRLHATDRPVAPDVDWAGLARRTPGFTGADLANVINEAALLSVRAGHDRISAVELDEAVLRVIGGTSTRGHLLTEAERQRVAVHEAGHAVVAALLGNGPQLHRVSLLARGRGLGLAEADDEAAVLSRSQVRDQLTTTLAGLAAETVVLGEPSTAAEDDLERASSLATAAVARYGMSDVVGPRRTMAVDADVHLGGSARLAEVSPELHARVDGAVDAMLDDARTLATALVTARRKHVDELAAALLEVETLDGKALQALLPAPDPDAGSTTARTGTGSRKKATTRRATPTARPADGA